MTRGRFACEVAAASRPNDPPATVRTCGAPAVVLVREEHTLHYRGAVKTWRDAWPGAHCAAHDVPARRVRGVEGSDDWTESRTVERRVL